MNELTGIYNTISRGVTVARETWRNQAFANEAVAKTKPISPSKVKLIKSQARLDETNRLLLLAIEDQLPATFIEWLTAAVSENDKKTRKMKNAREESTKR